ncbi:MAG: hypothetical protein A3I24_04305 [Candidatus Harrisonbacteria bacterium RIFCSPLOWO2_02_FULL_41_13b]|uniref:DUF5667 domain-containing protein n=1 Tax=Candidatus Harrisonbacteria bacterium RIFCSPLOWO2_02_FULL_41_13b TaxID=1798409 RepID=A0A1G1ZQT8_9BACT|nr:MAG: hypothetical protein A3J53_02930 [Candidatus Harrisonbacteria bacterium RIFCSPHIGHO2_02_FULL_40_20]OGY66881.1 MAG: hypothetical protein A3I24_04305 [Candidatus Harrisonbacteria bacterium RIFCSPLOWO2_02_FULL_41_13b]
MKSNIQFFVLASLFSFIVFSPLVMAQSEDPGILPNSPFYFLKEWGRVIEKIFTFTSLGKAELALEIAESKILELKKAQEVIPDNIDAVSNGLDKYIKNAEYLKRKLEKLIKRAEETGVDQLFNNLTFSVLAHQQLFDDLRSKFEFLSDLKSQLDQAQDNLTFILSDIPDFSRRVYLALAKQDSLLKELRVAEVLDQLEEKLEPAARADVLKLKEELVLKFGGRLEAQAIFSEGDSVLPILSDAPGDQLRRLKILDDIRESILNADVKSQLNIIRQRILDKAQEVGSINSRKAELAVAEAEKLTADVAVLTADIASDLSRSVKQLLERAKFNLGQAKDLFKQGNYGSAYGQATAAAAALKNVILQLSISSEDHSADVEALKKQFDSLSSDAKEKEFSEKEYPKLFDLFDEAEKKIAELSKIIASGKGSERIIASLRVTRLILATIEELEGSLK